MGDAVLGRGDVAGGSLFGIEFMHGHAQFSDKTYEQIMSYCHPHQLEGSMAIPPDSNCSQAQVEHFDFRFAHFLQQNLICCQHDVPGIYVKRDWRLLHVQSL